MNVNDDDDDDDDNNNNINNSSLSRNFNLTLPGFLQKCFRFLGF